MQYFNDLSKFWSSRPFYDTGSESGNSDGNAQSGSGEEATDGEVSGNSDGNANVTGDAATQTNDSAQDGELSHSELLARHTELQGKHDKLGESYGKQTVVLGDLRKQLRGEPSAESGRQTASESTGSVTLSEDQFTKLMEKREADPSGNATNGMQTLQQQVNSLSGSMQMVGDHLLHQRMVEKFTPQELQGYEARVVEMGTQLANESISYEEILHLAVRGERVHQIIAEAKKVGAKEYEEKLTRDANASIPSAGTGRQQSSGAPRRKEVEADEALERMNRARAS